MGYSISTLQSSVGEYIQTPSIEVHIDDSSKQSVQIKGEILVAGVKRLKNQHQVPGDSTPDIDKMTG